MNICLILIISKWSQFLNWDEFVQFSVINEQNILIG